MIFAKALTFDFLDIRIILGGIFLVILIFWFIQHIIREKSPKNKQHLAHFTEALSKDLAEDEKIMNTYLYKRNHAAAITNKAFYFEYQKSLAKLEFDDIYKITAQGLTKGEAGILEPAPTFNAKETISITIFTDHTHGFTFKNYVGDFGEFAEAVCKYTNQTLTL